jgi:hypothetical protein
MITSLLCNSRRRLTEIDLLLLHNYDLWALWDRERMLYPGTSANLTLPASLQEKLEIDL